MGQQDSDEPPADGARAAGAERPGDDAPDRRGRAGTLGAGKQPAGQPAAGAGVAQSAWSDADRALLFEHGSVGLFKTRPDGRILAVNDALARLMGWETPADMLAEVESLDRQVHVSPSRRAELVRKITAEKRIDEEVVEVRRRDGARLWVRQSARQVEDAEGRPLYYLGTLVDVTAEVEALQAAGRAEQGYREIFENAREGIYRSTLGGRQLRANPALVRLNGYDSEAELLAAVGDIAKEWYVDPGRRAEFARLMERDGKVEGFVSEIYRHKSRERIWIEENARLVRDDAGRPLYYEGSVQEITDRKAHEAELWRARLSAEDANRAKSSFLANMSHELRTPLNAIIGFAEVMLREFYGPVGERRYVEYLEDIRGSGLLLLQLLDDILDLSKVEAGKIELADEPVDLEQVAADCLRMLSSRAKTAGVALAPLRVPADLPLLRGDERRLRQIVLNLLSNAVKYNRPGGTVEVCLSAAPGAGLVLTVRDTGLGIPEAELERVFEPFVQLDEGPAGGTGPRRAIGRATVNREGVGLGLPLARQLVELHQGRIALASPPGEGTVARVDFPAERCLAREEAPRCGADG